MFKNRQHKPESNAKRSETMKTLHASGEVKGMGWPKYATEEERRQGRLSAQMKHRYGITFSEYVRMYEAQDGRCAICQKAFEKLNVDHNHETGEVRKLLCHTCNMGLGFVEKAGIENVAQYLRELDANNKHT